MLKHQSTGNSTTDFTDGTDTACGGTSRVAQGGCGAVGRPSVITPASRSISPSWRSTSLSSSTLVPDLIVDELVIVDTKVVTTFNPSHIAKMTGCLSHTGLRLGLLLNVKHAKLQWKRIVN